MAGNELHAAHKMADAAGHPPGDSIRDQINEFISSHATVWEIVFAALAVLVRRHGPGIRQSRSPDGGAVADAIEAGLTITFAIEFFGRLLAAPHPGAHFRAHFIDAVALLPPVRALRVLRLLRLIPVITHAYRASMRIKPLAKHRGFISLVAKEWELGVAEAGFLDLDAP